jgi:putative copper resistance protein D
VILGGIASLAATFLLGLLGFGALQATLDLPSGALLGADFILFTGLDLLAMLVLLALALPREAPGRNRRLALGGAALLVLLAVTFGSHAIARTEGRAMLLASTALHQAGAASGSAACPA